MLFHDEETTFSEFVAGQRLARAWRVLASIAFDCGFGNLSYFNRTFRKRFGCTPSEVRLQCARNNGPW
jgi:AraC-like DNA-binding protein